LLLAHSHPATPTALLLHWRVEPLCGGPNEWFSCYGTPLRLQYRNLSTPSGAHTCHSSSDRGSSSRYAHKHLSDLETSIPHRL
jgi:hypothetical protein